MYEDLAVSFGYGYFDIMLPNYNYLLRTDTLALFNLFNIDCIYCITSLLLHMEPQLPPTLSIDPFTGPLF